MTDLKSKINPMELAIPDVILLIHEVGAFIALPPETRTAINTHMRNHVTTQVLKDVNECIGDIGR